MIERDITAIMPRILLLPISCSRRNEREISHFSQRHTSLLLEYHRSRHIYYFDDGISRGYLSALSFLFRIYCPVTRTHYQQLMQYNKNYHVASISLAAGRISADILTNRRFDEFHDAFIFRDAFVAPPKWRGAFTPASARGRRAAMICSRGSRVIRHSLPGESREK